MPPRPSSRTTWYRSPTNRSMPSAANTHDEVIMRDVLEVPEPPGSPGSHDAIDRLIDRHGPSKICEALMPMMTPERIARIDAVLAMRLGSVVTCVEDTYDPHNAAATIRTTEALGLQELNVIEPHSRFSASQGVTRGAHRW